MYNDHQLPRGAGSAFGSASGSRGARGAGASSSNVSGALGAWADWAAKGLEYEERSSPVASLVERCTDPMNQQPNLALNLELADYVRDKKANTPRDAAVEVVRKINSRHPHVSMLALHLLDNLVKNCGYPFHLQISTKEFLNELVKRFPERPPLFPSPAQSKILELIHEWKNTICVTSKHKEDLVHIRDMHRLLGYKGYRFPNFDARAANVMNPENSLQTPEELEEEDRAAQGAKLQELIRRGTPRDLQQAQELMKIMSGAEPERKPDYASQTRKELDKVQSRAILLNDMLNNANEGEKFAKGDAYDQIAQHLRSVQPRLQRWIGRAEEEGSESEQLDRLLLINDLINQVCDRHRSYRKGDFSAKVTIDPSIDPRKGGADAVPTAKITDLISFGDDQPSASASAAAGGAGGAANLMDDFASLSFGEAAPQAQAQAQGGSSAAQTTQGLGGLPADLFSSPSTAAASGSTASTTMQQGWGALQLPMAGGNASGVSGFGSGVGGGSSLGGSNGSGARPATMGSGLAAGGTSGQAARTNGAGGAAGGASSNSQASAAATAKDPFADLNKLFG